MSQRLSPLCEELSFCPCTPSELRFGPRDPVAIQIASFSDLLAIGCCLYDAIRTLEQWNAEIANVGFEAL